MKFRKYFYKLDGFKIFKKPATKNITNKLKTIYGPLKLVKKIVFRNVKLLRFFVKM